MKRIILILIALWAVDITHGQQTDDFFNKANQFLATHVDVQGQIDYNGIKAQPQQLDELVRLIANTKVETLQGDDLKAFEINAYNLLVIKGIIDRYPVGSPLTIAGFFDGNKYTFGGQAVTLNDIEKKRLLPRTQDARLHFVLVCAAKGCPPLANFAYDGQNLEQQLQQRTQEVLNNDNFLRPERNTVLLSKIFKWYKSDFTRSGSVWDYINAFRTNKIAAGPVQYYSYDWSLNDQSHAAQEASKEVYQSNVQQFTPSALLQKGQIELNFFNNLYTQNQVRDAEGSSVSLGSRQTFLTQSVQFTYGASEKANLNVGLELQVNHAWYGGEDSFNRSVIGAVGPRIKFRPFANIPRFSVQSTFLFPVASDLETPRFVAHDRYTWNNQFFYDRNLGNNFQIFLEADFLYRIARNSTQDDFFRTPLTAILSYFPVPRATLFALVQHDPLFGTLRNEQQSEFGRVGYFTQLGLGAKYQLTTNINLEASYTNFVDSKRDGAGSTFNFGIRLIR